MRKRDTFMHPPHGDWLICMALTMKHCAFHGMTFEAALDHALEAHRNMVGILSRNCWWS